MRHLFDIPDEVTYLNCAYLSPQLKAVTAAGVEAVRQKASPWRVVAEDFFEASERARGLFAKLLGTSAENVALIPAVSYGIGVAAANIPITSDQSIVLLEEQFPSNVYPWRAAAQAHGARIVTVPRTEGGWTHAVLDAIDDRTAVVALPACHWTDGTCVDLVEVGQRCREVGAALVLDLTQSLGAAPFDMAAVQPDFVVASGYKWLLGPYSLGFMAAAPRWHGGLPLEHNWITREHSEDFAQLVQYRDTFQPGARRYDVGERSNFIQLPMSIAALTQILDWGIDHIATSLRGITDEIAARAEAIGLSAPGPRGPHLLGLRFPNGLPDGLAARLESDGISVSIRGDAIRVSPHLYNTAQDIDRFFDALRPFTRGST